MRQKKEKEAPFYSFFSLVFQNDFKTTSPDNRSRDTRYTDLIQNKRKKIAIQAQKNRIGAVDSQEYAAVCQFISFQDARRNPLIKKRDSQQCQPQGKGRKDTCKLIELA